MKKQARTTKKVAKETVQKNKGGRPLKYTPEELRAKADSYFEMCKKTIVVDKGTQGKIHKPFTISGFVIYAEISKGYLFEIEKNKEFFETVAYIRGKVENDVEEKTLTGIYSPSAGSFNLRNNFGWKEKIETENTNKHTFPELTEEQKKKIADRYK